MTAHPEIARIIKEDRWALSRGEYEGKPVMVRFREPLLKLKESHGYDQLLRVVWPYGGEEESGMPSDEDMNQLDKFEGVLSDTLEKDGLAICTAVITTWGYREWVLYTTDFESCEERISGLSQPSVPYPIELEAEADEEWHYLKQNILAGMTEETDE